MFHPKVRSSNALLALPPLPCQLIRQALTPQGSPERLRVQSDGVGEGGYDPIAGMVSVGALGGSPVPWPSVINLEPGSKLAKRTSCAQAWLHFPCSLS